MGWVLRSNGVAEPDHGYLFNRQSAIVRPMGIAKLPEITRGLYT